MARKSTIGGYNATIAAIKRSTGVTHKEAQQTYRAAAVRLGRAPTAKDAKSKAVREESAKAGQRIAAGQRAKARAVERSIARGRMTAKERKAAAAAGTPAPAKQSRGGRSDAIEGGSGGGGGRVAKSRPSAEPEYEPYYELEYPDIEGEVDGDSPEGE